MSFNVETSRTLTEGLAAEAMGSDLGPDGVRRWRFAGDCECPVEMRLAGRPDRLMVGLGLQKEVSYNGWLYARCRVCKPCLEARSRLWAARACDEIIAGERNWFGTLTVSPVNRVRALYQAQLKLSRGGSEWAELDPKAQFGALVSELSPEVTKMLKRVRKNSDASFRYLVVVEAHKDGFPHFHLLLHEHERTVAKAVLDAAWKLGFTKWRLVKDRGPEPAFYVAKYLAKSAIARIRASKQYGRGGTALAAQRAIAAVGPMTEALAMHLAQKKDCSKEGPPKVGLGI